MTEFNSESDLDFLYYNGYIDYNSYQLYRELFDGAAIEDTLDFLVSTLGLSPIEAREFYQNIKGGTFIPDKKRTGPDYKGHFKLGRRIADSWNNGYLWMTASGRDLSFEMKIKDESGARDLERRSFMIRRERYIFVIGNYNPDIGCGLGIGRFDYRPVSYERDSHISDILFPDNSHYNGVMAEIRGRYTVLYSIKKYGNVYKNCFGSAFLFPVNGIKAGFTGLFTSLANGGGNTRMGAGSIFLNSMNNHFRSEIAYANSGFGGCTQYKRPDYLLKGWYYEHSYLNLQSSGFSYPDYENYTLKSAEISFRQAQSGEAGFYMRKLLGLPKTETAIAAEFWKNGEQRRINFNNSIRSNLHIHNEIIPYAAYSTRNLKRGRRNEYEIGMYYNNRHKLDISVLLYCDNKTVEKSFSISYIFASIQLSDNMFLSGRLRFGFDGSIDYLVEEYIRFEYDLVLKAAYRWNDELGSDLGILYITVGN